MKWLEGLVGFSLMIDLVTLAAGAESTSTKIGKFPQEYAQCYTIEQGLPSNDVLSVCLDAQGRIFAQTQKGWAVWSDRKWSKCDAPAANALVDNVDSSNYASFPEPVNQVAKGPKDRLVIATNKGLLERKKACFQPLVVEDGRGCRWGCSDVRGVIFDSKGQLWFSTPAGIACQTIQGWKFFTGQQGLPYSDFTRMCAGPDGVVWFGTHLGAIRFDGSNWAYRQGRRWLPNDDVRDIVVDAKGNAWFATAVGVGCIEQRMITLAEKASFYEDEMDRCIRRTPYGYVSEVELARPGDKSRIFRHDSDNDGLWTSMYGAGECFAYGAKHDPKAKNRAKQAFEALRFLQKVTQGCEHSPPIGYVARTILPTDGPDPNVGLLERDRIQQRTEDPLWKVYEPRWPKSADGKWYWKSDTSSDELDGHYFFYPLYYDLVADTEEEKSRVREVVRDLTDHLINHDYCLIDHDGKPTRWAVYGPKQLNHDPNWWADRGLKSLSILAYLAVAEHITGDPKYGKHLEKLVNEHSYDANMMTPKTQRGIGSGNQSDDEMAFMSFYSLMKYAKNDKLRQQVLVSFYNAWVLEEPEMNPFFHFAYAAFGLKASPPKISLGPWDEPIENSTAPFAPWNGWLEDSVATLKGFPLDRLNWASKNSHRLDIVKLPRQQSLATIRTGYRVNGKVIPVENRHFNHWNTDPWQLDYDGDGRQLANGTVFLLPYYMGLYHGLFNEVE